MLKSLHSPDWWGPTSAPNNPDAVLFQAMIGPADGEGEESFSFIAATPDGLRDAAMRWGRGYLVVAELNWNSIEEAVRQLLLHAQRETWNEVGEALNKFMDWEFDGYREA